jgi:hypothetical protein
LKIWLKLLRVVGYRESRESRVFRAKLGQRERKGFKESRASLARLPEILLSVDLCVVLALLLILTL